MAKRESLNKESLNLDLEQSVSDKGQKKAFSSMLSGQLFSIVKFMLGICLLPYVWGISVSLLKELGAVEKIQQDYFWVGIITLVLIHFFIWEPQIIYAKGHRLLEIIFSFFQPLVKLAPYLLPIYTILLLIAYAIFSPLATSESFTNTFIFFCGFSIALHLVFAAKTLRSKREDFLKGNYIFGFSFVYIVTLLFAGLCFVVFSSEFSFANFFTGSLQKGSSVFYAIFRQLFIINSGS